MPDCPRCRKFMDDNAHFCSNCGERLDKEDKINEPNEDEWESEDKQRDYYLRRCAKIRGRIAKRAWQIDDLNKQIMRFRAIPRPPSDENWRKLREMQDEVNNLQQEKRQLEEELRRLEDE